MAILGPTTRAALRKFESNGDVVEEVRVHHDSVRVTYKDTLVETWDLDGNRRRGLRLPKDGLWGGEPIEVSKYHSLRLLDDDYDPAADLLFEYTKRGVRRAGWLDTRLVIHRLVERLVGEGWIRPSFPRSALESDLASLGADAQRYALSPGYVRGQPGRPVSTVPPGFLLCLHALDWGSLAAPGRPTLAEAWFDPRRLLWAIEGLVRRGQAITRASIIHRLVCGRAEGFPAKAGPRWVPPSYWIAVLRDVLNLDQALVIDAGHDCGSRAVAVGALCGIYLHDPAVAFSTDGPLWKEGAEIEPDDDDQSMDVVFADCQDLTDFEDTIEEYGHRAERIVGGLPWCERDAALALPGVSVVRYRPRPYLGDAVLAVWRPS